MIRYLFVCFISLLISAGWAAAFPKALLKKSNLWFQSDEGKRVVGNVLSWQAESGSWPKNQDNSRPNPDGERSKTGTFDNNSTMDELRFLARAVEVGAGREVREAFLLGFDHIIEAQYGNGGWPQYFPPSKGYARHITFNDDAMVNILLFLREVQEEKRYKFIGKERLEAASEAFELGIECILKCQFVQDGKRTVWCAQHDEVTLAPAMARSYELESLSGAESARIVRFLMTLDSPSSEVVSAVRDAVEWFERSAVVGIRLEKIDGVKTVVEDRKAKPIWARFYDLETNRPFYCDRDGVKKWNHNEIGKERRNGYAWLGYWGESVIREYAKWKYR